MVRYISWWLCLLAVYTHLASSVNITITSSPRLGVGTLCQNDSVTLTCHSDQPGAEITWLWSNQSEQGDITIVLAELSQVVCTCIVSDDGHFIGQANVTVIANGSAPLVSRENFRYYITRTEGANITLTATVTTDLPLSSGYPVWQVVHGMLPSNAKVDNYTIDGVLYSNLSLYNLSYYENSGNYTFTASNECGTSSVFTFIEVTEAPIVCKDPGDVAVPLHDIIYTVQGDFIQIGCLFKGNLAVLGFSLTSYWEVIPPPEQKHNESYITDNSTDPYRIAVYQTCLTSDGSCCNFTNQLTIQNIPLSLNDNELTCVESLRTDGHEPAVHTSGTTIMVLVTPRIISGPLWHEDQSKIMLHCKFNASTLPEVTVVAWEKNSVPLSNSSLYKIIQYSIFEDQQVVSILTISTSDYYGHYTCYCCYNTSLVTSSKSFICDQSSLTLNPDQEKNKHGLSVGDWIIIVVGCCTLLLFIIAVVLIRNGPSHGDQQSARPLLTLDRDDNVPETNAQQEIGHSTTAAYGATDQSASLESDGNQVTTSSSTGGESKVSQTIKPDESTKAKTSGSTPAKATKPVDVPKKIHPNEVDKTTPSTQTDHAKQLHGASNCTKHGSSNQKYTAKSHSINSGSWHTQHIPNGKLPSSFSANNPTGESEVSRSSKPDESLKSKPSSGVDQALKLPNSVASSIERFPVEASDWLNNKKSSLPAQQNAFPQQFHHHDHKTVVINKVQITVTSESAQEQLSLDAANLLRQHATDFNQLVNIEILAPVLFQNELLTQQDMEQLQLPTMTESKKRDYVYLKMVQLGGEEYKKFLSCLKNQYAVQYAGHLKLYEKLHQ